MQFMDIVCLAMILRIRDELLSGDQNDCFSCLFQYPPLEDIHKLVLISEKIKYCMENKTNNNKIATYVEHIGHILNGEEVLAAFK